MHCYDEGYRIGRCGAPSLAHHYRGVFRMEYEAGYEAGLQKRQDAQAEGIEAPKHAQCNSTLTLIGSITEDQWYCPQCCRFCKPAERF